MTDLEAVRKVIVDVLCLEHFQTAFLIVLDWEHRSSEETPWEIYRGQLVPRHLTREGRTLESWNVYSTQNGLRSDEPLISLKLDAERGEVHVVRGLLCYVWEGYESENNVFLSREVERWMRELVATIRIEECETPEQLWGRLSSLVFHAVVGISRLPLTSLEAPLPAWTLGLLAYFPAAPRSLTVAALNDSALAPRYLEWLIRSRSATELRRAIEQFLSTWQELGKSSRDTILLFRSMFNGVSLSPYTDFVDKALQFLRLLVDCGHLTIEQQVDFLGWLLRQLARHLTAYDLVTFHHRGANYPDALLLDAALKEYLRLLEQHPRLFVGDDTLTRLRRRALRLGWLHRRRYEDYPVPDAPTSPGENACVLPPPHVRVPEEQILNPAKRTKRLYAGDPLTDRVGPNARAILRQCGSDLQDCDELRELGMAIFIERPLGTTLAVGEPDFSPLLAHEAYSRSLAEKALMELAGEPLMGLSAEDTAYCRCLLEEAWPTGGIRAIELPVDRQRVVSLADAAKAAKDFVILRTLPSSVRAFCERADVAAVLREEHMVIDSKDSWLVVANVTTSGKRGVLIRDVLGKRVLELEVDELQRVKAAAGEGLPRPEN